ncbi:MAG: lipoprotein [Deltaproteobacteria bacterium]|nr:lipoprotein [Deltaproteobacteria bacterium]MCL4873875.1 lipoprotein [bacterium]
MKKTLLLFLALLILAGCAPWIRTGGKHSAPAQNVSLDLPDGWMRYRTDEYLFVTRDGGNLQYIMVEAIHVDSQLKHTKKKFHRGMLPLELSEIIADNMSSNQAISGLKVVENKSAKIGGRQGFRAVMNYRNKDGLKIKSVYYGFMKDDWFYGVSYAAPLRHYFSRDVKTFEKVAASLSLIRK